MIILNTPQGTTDWLMQRLWKLTASEASANITSTGKLSKSEAALGAIDRMLAGIDLANVMLANRAKIDEMDEWDLKKFMAHYTGDKFSGSIHTERGHELEPDALAALAEKSGWEFQEVGMCVMGDSENGVISCSPDGIVLRANGQAITGAEVKSPCLHTWNKQLMSGEPAKAYKLQIHFSMAVCEVDSWHFGSYFPGKPLLYEHVRRDTFTDRVHQSLEDFKELYATRFADYKEKLGALEVEKQKEILEGSMF